MRTGTIRQALQTGPEPAVCQGLQASLRQRQPGLTLSQASMASRARLISPASKGRGLRSPKVPQHLRRAGTRQAGLLFPGA